VYQFFYYRHILTSVNYKTIIIIIVVKGIYRAQDCPMATSVHIMPLGPTQPGHPIMSQ